MLVLKETHTHSESADGEARASFPSPCCPAKKGAGRGAGAALGWVAQMSSGCKAAPSLAWGRDILRFLCFKSKKGFSNP